MDGVNTLIVQWDNRPHYSNVGNATFQLQLFETGAVGARFAYQDVVFGNASYDHGASATIGYQLANGTAGTFSQDTASVFDGDVIDLIVTERDVYAIDLGQDESITVQTATPFDGPDRRPLNTLDPHLALLDSSGTELVADANSLDGKNALLTFMAPSQGTYYVAVGNDAGSGEYLLSLSRSGNSGGDFDHDGDYDCDDIDALTNAVANGGSLATFDLNGDGNLTLEDVDAWRVEAGAVNLGGNRVYLPGDADLSGFVDGSDFGIWNANKFTVTAAWCSGDFSANGVVDGTDFGIWNTNKFQSSDAATVFRNAPPQTATSLVDIRQDRTAVPVTWSTDDALPRVKLPEAVAARSGAAVGRGAVDALGRCSHSEVERRRELAIDTLFENDVAS